MKKGPVAVAALMSLIASTSCGEQELDRRQQVSATLGEAQEEQNTTPDDSNGAMLTSANGKIKIMPLGDSITNGLEALGTTKFNYGGYRVPLYRALNAAYPGAIDFVGSASVIFPPGNPSDIDTGNQGHSGYTTCNFENEIKDYLNNAQPNIILLMLGTNDVTQNLPWSESERCLNIILSNALATPSVKQVLIASAPPIFEARSATSTPERTKAFNASLKPWVYAQMKAGKPVQFVDMHTNAGLTPNDLCDRLHPNREGYAKIAKVWERALSSKLATRGDHNRDNKADIYATSGSQLQILTMNGKTQQSTIAYPHPVPNGYTMQANADFNSDGISDIIWRNFSTGDNLVWLMGRSDQDAPTVVKIPNLVGVEWQIVGAADMSNDGLPDIIWQNQNTMATQTWVMGEGARVLRPMTAYAVPTAGYRIDAISDFNHDGYPDFLYRNNSKGKTVLWYLLQDSVTRAGEQSLVTRGPEWSMVASGDLTGDGYGDLVWKNSSTNAYQLDTSRVTIGSTSPVNFLAEPLAIDVAGKVIVGPR